MSEHGPGPRDRVRVTGPSRRTLPRATSRLGDMHEQNPVGDVFLRSLLREQLGLAIRVLLIVVVVLGGLPLFFHLAPDQADRELLGLPVAWLLLGVAVYPFLVLLAWGYVRRVERNERVFTDLVGED